MCGVCGARGHGKLQSWQFSSRKPILNSILESSYAWPRRQREADLHFYSTPLCCLSKRRKSLANTLWKCQIQTRGCVENCHVRLNDACGHKKMADGRRRRSSSSKYPLPSPYVVVVVVTVCSTYHQNRHRYCTMTTYHSSLLLRENQ